MSKKNIIHIIVRKTKPQKLFQTIITKPSPSFVRKHIFSTNKIGNMFVLNMPKNGDGFSWTFFIVPIFIKFKRSNYLPYRFNNFKSTFKIKNNETSLFN